MKAIVIVFISVFSIGSLVLSQEDGLSPYVSYNDYTVWSFEPGMTWAPASIKYNFSDEISKIDFRHNMRMSGGFGMSYKWFSIFLSGVMIPNMRPIEEYGKVNYYDFTLQLSLKNMYFNFDVRNYRGYMLKDAYRWNEALSLDTPNDLNQNIQVTNVNLKTWEFRNPSFHIQPFSGSKGIYNKEVLTWLWASKVEYFRIHNKNGSLIPERLHDPKNSVTQLHTMVAFEIGALPGVGYVNKYKNWQYGTILAAGPRLQMKAYAIDDMRTFIGLIGRYDAKFVFGYSVPKFYAMLYFDIDNKAITISDVKYQQQFYSLKLQIGIRELH